MIRRQIHVNHLVLQIHGVTLTVSEVVRGAKGAANDETSGVIRGFCAPTD